MSLDTDSRATTRRVVPTVRERTSPSMRLASLSQRFFSKGEEQEANGYQNVVLEPDDALSAPDLEFDSFDKIPRRRRPLLTIAALLVSLPVVGYVAWKSTRGLGGGRLSVNESAQAMVVGGQPAAAAPSMPTTPAEGPPPGGPGAPANPAPSEPPVVASGTCPPAESAPAAAAAPAREPEENQPRPAAQEPAREAAPVAAAAPSIPAQPAAAPRAEPRAETRRPTIAAKAVPKAEPEPEEAAAESGSTRPAAKTRSSGSALRGYVWSPEANALVPASEPAKADPVNSDRGSAPTEPAAAPPVDGFKVAPAPRVAAPAERPAPPPPEQAAPIIE